MTIDEVRGARGIVRSFTLPSCPPRSAGATASLGGPTAVNSIVPGSGRERR